MTVFENETKQTKKTCWLQLTRIVAILSGNTFADTAKDDVTAPAKPTAFTDLMIKQRTMKMVPSGALSRNLHNRKKEGIMPCCNILGLLITVHGNRKAIAYGNILYNHVPPTLRQQFGEGWHMSATVRFPHNNHYIDNVHKIDSLIRGIQYSPKDYST